ncbi:hypothetical protein [Chitinophaga deserti]|uniref:hypothetical protein n=1 Tax=Chitinophaga deserti TaxID=2164099 RepID=UPI000D6C43FB|nr:hypothetical protein [Chitinophaga deserti]
MASTQSGLLQMLGPTQNMSIYRKRNGEYGLRRKGGPTAKRFAKDPNYAQARINTSEFGQAAKGSALIRRAFRAMMPKVANDELHSRLTKVCKDIINSDTSHQRGSRMLMNGNLSLLRGFNFSPAGKFGLIVSIPLHHTVDRTAGTVRIGMPAFAPADAIRFPKHATHARLKMGVAVLNFEKDMFTFVSACSSPIPKGRKPINPEDLTVQIPAGTSDPLFIAMAVEFLMLEKGAFCPVPDSQFKLMQLTGVDLSATAAEQQIHPQEEALLVAKAETGAPLSLCSPKLQNANLSENCPVNDMQQLEETSEGKIPDQLPYHNASRAHSGETRTEALERHPDKWPVRMRTSLPETSKIRRRLFKTAGAGGRRVPTSGFAVQHNGDLIELAQCVVGRGSGRLTVGRRSRHAFRSGTQGVTGSLMKPG